MMNTEAGDHTTIARAIARNLKVIREREGLSLNELATRAKIGKSTISVLESGKGNPNIETLWAIASALKVPFGHLLDAVATDVRVVRRGHGLRVDTRDETMTADLLVSRARRGAFEMYQIELKAGARRLAEPHARGTTEHVLVIRGHLRIGDVGDPTELRVGDLASFSADCAHVYEAVDGPAKALVVMDYP